MEDDGFWRDVEDAYAELIVEGIHPSDKNLWTMAKERVMLGQIFRRALEISKREGRDYGEIVAEFVKDEKQRKIN